MKKKSSFIAILLFWFIIFGVFIGVKEYILYTGTKVMFKVIPVNYLFAFNKNLFTNDNIRLRYKINTVDSRVFPSRPKAGDKIYVSLDLDGGGYAIPSGFYALPPKKGVYITGVVSVGVYRGHQLKDDYELKVDYGIESYFVPEELRKTIDKLIKDKNANVEAIVVIDRYGNAMIQNITVKGNDPSADAGITF